MKRNTNYLLLLSVCCCTIMPAQAQSEGTGVKSVALNYFLEHVSEPVELNWQILSTELAWAVTAKENKTTLLLIPRLNMGQRTGAGVSWFDHVALQGQLDAYWNISSRFSLFAGYGYSGANTFAKHQFFGELTYALPKGWAMTGGVKMTQWEHTNMTYLLEVEKYVHNFHFTLRPMWVIANKDNFMAVRFSTRYYLNQTTNFIHLAVFYGNSPEYANYMPDLQKILSLGSWGGYAYWQQDLGKKLALRLGASWRHEEYKNNTWRSVWGINTGITYKF
ncbi:YaiO family outer membrane beta-barrel protein [uncultured Parabacteroides sp.]|jgi:YaiO family outer membrane protein|uniref:YaiO family outer membrane beta-barrel protein n=1 Tax=uncultured Parabacteroides sp. TaxID=512312 RepID=UPI0025FA5877|nr:YaiO family outer membrane beta-barrel protein [uncultured Parabacteroides sp.]